MVYPKKNTAINSSRNTLRNIVIIIVVLIILVIVADYVRIARFMEIGLKRYYSSNSFNQLANIPYFTPSIYIYFSGNPVVFSEYLKAGGEQVFPGWYSLAPIYHFLGKFGLFKYVTFYQKFYFTPIPLNTGTYLRELHADYGIWGILGFPFLLGALSAYLSLKNTKRLWEFVLLVYIFVIIIFSVFYNAMQLGGWLITLIVAVFISNFIDIRIKSRRQ
jgi:oligosaccharide repeat unit polymerase